jgi:uncharacterized protein
VTVETQQALQRLETQLQKFPGIVIAFSGGMDSSFMAIAARRFLGDRVRLLFCRTELISQTEADVVAVFEKRYQIPVQVLEISVLQQESLMANPPDRCYHCKRFLFSRFRREVPEGWVLCDGSNLDDRNDYRPGKRALQELSVASPLDEAGFTKVMIREMLMDWGCADMIQFPHPCLATRIPCGTPLTSEALRLVEAGEMLISRTGLAGFRLRLHGDLGRIEVPAAALPGAISMLQSIVADLKRLGLRHVTLDLEGYQQGSMNR